MSLKSFTNFQVALKSVSQVVLPDSFVPGSKSDENQTVTVNDFAVSESLTSSSTPVPAEILSDSVTIDGTGSHEIDLTDAAIVGAVDGSGDPAATEDLTGSQLFYIEIHTGSANAGVLTVGPSVSNGYTLFGTGNSIDIPPNSHVNFYVKSSDLPAVSSTVKAITFAGTTGDTFDVVMTFEAP